MNSDFKENLDDYLYEDDCWYTFDVVTKKCVPLEEKKIKKKKRRLFFLKFTDW